MSSWLWVGLGNPGPEYASNRHNIGFMVLDALAAELRTGSMRNKFGGELVETSVGDARVVLLKPQQYMNLSGEAVSKTSAFFKIASEQIVVVHDEIDLPYEALRVKVGGGHGGHNGLRSISEHIGPAYVRVRCGVGKPQTAGDRERVVGHVLGDFSKAEQKTLPIFLNEAAAAVRLVLDKGITVAMNQVNQPKAKNGGNRAS